MSTYTGQGRGTGTGTEKRTTMVAHMQSEVKWKLEGSNESVSGVRREVRIREGGGRRLGTGLGGGDMARAPRRLSTCVTKVQEVINNGKM